VLVEFRRRAKSRLAQPSESQWRPEYVIWKKTVELEDSKDILFPKSAPSPGSSKKNRESGNCEQY